MIFENRGMGRCVVLKESDTEYSLVFAIDSKQFIVVSCLDNSTGSWLHGNYFGNDLDNALLSFNMEVNKLKDNLER